MFQNPVPGLAGNMVQHVGFCSCFPKKMFVTNPQTQTQTVWSVFTCLPPFGSSLGGCISQLNGAYHHTLSVIKREKFQFLTLAG